MATSGLHLVPRLTQAQLELQQVHNIIVGQTWADLPDKRCCLLADVEGKFQKSALYKLLLGSQGAASPTANFIWQIVDDDCCEVCG